ncbi:proteinase-activated receptor 4-like [Amblyraja radiata]|uniref:proteinase-activated receptor 4-like n=1 Tax=Amblyraja radiata TaxID=386614 RepID=UPI001403AB4A|nr:proteinase-activated receptor 4-like [Amblyraja radiata]
MKLPPLQALVWFTLISFATNCGATGKIEAECRNKSACKSRKFPIVQVHDPVTNQTINKFNDSAMVHLRGKVTTVVIPSFFVVVFAIGLPANGLALWILATRVKRLPSTLLLMNLAVADLLVLLGLPWRIAYHLLGNDWPFGEAFCRVSSAILYGNVYSSILFLTCIGADRYLAIVHPFFSKEVRNKRNALCLCGAVWLLLVLGMVPLYTTQLSHRIHTLNITTCYDSLLPDQRRAHYPYLIGTVVIGFMAPCLIVVFCYVSIIATLLMNEQRYGHAVVATLLVLLVFLVCLVPYNVALLVQSYNWSSDVYYYAMICLVVSTFSNCIDPFIYYYISEEFRNKLKSMISAYMSETGSGKSDQSTVRSSTHSQPKPPLLV